MTNEEKIALFEKEISYMEIEDIKSFFKKAITTVPDISLKFRRLHLENSTRCLNVDLAV